MPNKVKQISVNFKDKGKGTKVKFNPTISESEFTDHYKNLMSGFALAFIELFNNVKVLRPASKEERELHCYIFKTDDKKDEEHIIKTAREGLYNEAKNLFEELLKTVFPDVEYLESCRVYQQNFFFEDFPNKDDYTKAVADLAKTVRENYDNILKQVYLEQPKESVNNDETNKEEEKE